MDKVKIEALITNILESR